MPYYLDLPPGPQDAGENHHQDDMIHVNSNKIHDSAQKEGRKREQGLKQVLAKVNNETIFK